MQYRALTRRVPTKGAKRRPGRRRRLVRLNYQLQRTSRASARAQHPSTTPPTRLARQVDRLQDRALASGLVASSTAGRRPGWLVFASTQGLVVPCRNRGYTLDGSDQRRAAAGHGQRLGRRLGQRRTRRPRDRGNPHPGRWRLRRDHRRRQRQRRRMDRGFPPGRDRLAVLRVSGQPYDHALKDALAYPTNEDAHGGTLTLPGGELALFSSALDEVRDNSMPLVGRRPGRRPGPTGRPPCPRPVPRWSQDCW